MNSTPLPSHSMWRFVACAIVVVAGLNAANGIGHAADQQTETPSETPSETPWGSIASSKDGNARQTATVKSAPPDGKLLLPTPSANITRAYYSSDRTRHPLTTEFNKDATRITLHLGDEKSRPDDGIITLETAEKSGQFPDGRIVLSALDAKVTGSRAKLETHPGNHRIGFWTNVTDHVSWGYRATRPGMYDVQLTYSGDGNDGTEIEVAVGDTKLAGKLKTTGSWYRYTCLSLGKVQIPQLGNIPVTVRCTKKTGGAVMNLKSITLQPACEGKPPVQGDDGTVVCHARDVTIHGVKVRYEPQPKKNTVGYWANSKDFVTWDFQINKPGRFDVEILQGCGKGQGGSEIIVNLVDKQLRFTVKDTGHFQNFIVRTIGQVEIDKPGWHTMEFRPVNKTRNAIVDLRRVRLIPAAAK